MKFLLLLVQFFPNYRQVPVGLVRYTSVNLLRVTIMKCIVFILPAFRLLLRFFKLRNNLFGHDTNTVSKVSTLISQCLHVSVNQLVEVTNDILNLEILPDLIFDVAFLFFLLKGLKFAVLLMTQGLTISPNFIKLSC